jgi:hypothetical protein
VIVGEGAVYLAISVAVWLTTVTPARRHFVMLPGRGDSQREVTMAIDPKDLDLTPEQRRREVAAILAKAILRWHRGAALRAIAAPSTEASKVIGDVPATDPSRHEAGLDS